MPAVKEKVNLGSPGSYALYGGQPANGFTGLHRRQCLQIEIACDDGFRHAYQRIRLCRGQTETRAFAPGDTQIVLRCQRPGRGKKPSQDCIGTCPRDELRNHDTGKTRKSRDGRTGGHRARSFGNGGKGRIDLQQSRECIAVNGGANFHDGMPLSLCPCFMAEGIMPLATGQQPVFRFAPSPNGRLHLGHALSAFLNHDMARATGGLYLVRIEDIDSTRCLPEFEASILDDLSWLGLTSDRQERRQSDHLADYQDALTRLQGMGLVYPSFLSRGEVKAIVKAHEDRGRIWPRDPDGAPRYPDTDRLRHADDRAERLGRGEKHSWRLDMSKALDLAGGDLSWMETGGATVRRIAAHPAEWGDVVLSRSDAPSSYTLSVVVDDAAQGVTHVVRGQDLFHATSVQRLLQVLLGLPEPIYHHHRLVLDQDGRKLSKSNQSTALSELRAGGATPSDIRRLVGI